MLPPDAHLQQTSLQRSMAQFVLIVRSNKRIYIYIYRRKEGGKEASKEGWNEGRKGGQRGGKEGRKMPSC